MAEQFVLDFDAEPEEWRVVADFSDYEVSSLGRVRRIADHTGRLGKQHPAGKFLKQTNRGKGYLCVSLASRSRPRPKMIPIAVLVCEAFHGPRPTPRHEAAHNDGTRNNNRASNVRWATHAENCADKNLHGTAQLGMKNPHAILTDDQVREIRRLYVKGKRNKRALAAHFGICVLTFSRVGSRMMWKHVED